MQDEKEAAWQNAGPPAAKDKALDSALYLREHGHQVMRLFGKNTLWLLLDRAGLKVGAMLAGLVLVAYLGPANLGIYSTAIAIGTLLNALIDLGLTRYAARVVAASPEEAAPILALTLTTTTLATAVELIAVALMYRSGHWYATCLCVGFIFTNLEGTSSLCTGILSADMRSRSVLPGCVKYGRSPLNHPGSGQVPPLRPRPTDRTRFEVTDCAALPPVAARKVLA